MFDMYKTKWRGNGSLHKTLAIYTLSDLVLQFLSSFITNFEQV